jgi:hypothetical protein
LVFSSLVVVGGLAAWAASPWHAGHAPPRTGKPATQGDGLEGTGVIQYDPPGTADAMLGANGNLVGNVFNTRVGNPLTTGNVSAMAFYPGDAGATFPYVGVVKLTPFSVLTLPAFTGVVGFTFNTVPLAVTGAVPPLFGGVLVSSFFASSADSVGMQSQSTLGQGFHAGSLPYGGPVIPLGNRNGMVRLSGSIWVVPVELMEFEAEAE